MKLHPVAFYYKPELESTTTRQYGLVAEEVAQIAPDLVVFNQEGQPETVRYHFVNAMLLNEVQKQRRLIEAQQRENEIQKTLNQAQQQQLAAQQQQIDRLNTALQNQHPHHKPHPPPLPHHSNTLPHLLHQPSPPSLA